MRATVTTGVALVSLCALVAAQGCSKSGPASDPGATTSGAPSSAAALPTLAAQSQSPGPRITCRSARTENRWAAC